MNGDIWKYCKNTASLLIGLAHEGLKSNMVGASLLTLFHEQNKAVLNDNRKSNCLATVDIEKLVSL